jgi:chromosomal replication initiator protein
MISLMDTTEMWESVLAEMELAVSTANFNTWFKDTHLLKEEGGVVYIAVPNAFVRSWLAEKYHKQILKILRNLSEHVRSIEYVISRDKATADAGRFTPATGGKTLPLEPHYIDKADNLNPRYTFESFVVGPFNELAHAAAQAVVNNLGAVYNPLFIYGKTGRGKTHLTQAIGNYVKKNSDKKVYYMTSEKFAVELVNSLQNNTANAFKEKYRKYDVLIMDDIQFISNKEKTQEELFHLFNTLYDSNKQIVFSSDMHPNYVPNLEERLRSRFSAGMIVDIPAPDHESRTAILHTKAALSNTVLSEEVIEVLANSIDSNIRELEGALNMVVMQTQLKERQLTSNEVKNLIRNSIKAKKSVPVSEVIKVITDYYGIDEEQVHKKTRKKEVVKPRQVIMYILREDYQIAYPTIGQKLGGRDHTTVIHSYEKIKRNLKVDNALGQEINQIRAML